MKIRVKITGKVHDVGYRVFLANMAIELGVDRFSASNSFAGGKEVVIALLDCKESVIDEFKKRIEEEKPANAIVESIEYEAYDGSVPPVERFMQFFQMEQWGKAIPIMIGMNSKQDNMLEKQDKMLEKQDETLHEIKGMREDLKTYMNKRFDYIEEELAKIKKILKNAGMIE